MKLLRKSAWQASKSAEGILACNLVIKCAKRPHKEWQWLPSLKFHAFLSPGGCRSQSRVMRWRHIKASTQTKTWQQPHVVNVGAFGIHPMKIVVSAAYLPAYCLTNWCIPPPSRLRWKTTPGWTGFWPMSRVAETFASHAPALHWSVLQWLWARPFPKGLKKLLTLASRSGRLLRSWPDRSSPQLLTCFGRFDFWKLNASGGTLPCLSPVYSKTSARWYLVYWHVLVCLLPASAQCELAWLCVIDILHGSVWAMPGAMTRTAPILWSKISIGEKRETRASVPTFPQHDIFRNNHVAVLKCQWGSLEVK